MTEIINFLYSTGVFLSIIFAIATTAFLSPESSSDGKRYEDPRDTFLRKYIYIM